MPDDQQPVPLDAPLSLTKAEEAQRVTGLDLDELERLCEQATPGPWKWDEEGDANSNDWDGHGPDLLALSVLERHGSLTLPKTVIGSWGHDAWGLDIEEVDAAFIAASRTAVPALIAALRAAERERDTLREALREAESLLDCTEFALDWLILHHVIEDGGKDWRSRIDGSAFFACDCSEGGGYMEYDTNAYIHTERCASGFEDSLPALYDQIKAARGHILAALAGPERTTPGGESWQRLPPGLIG